MLLTDVLSPVVDVKTSLECPLDHTPNAETIAAIKEGCAMMRGEIPCKWMNLEELMQDLYS